MINFFCRTRQTLHMLLNGHILYLYVFWNIIYSSFNYGHDPWCSLITWDRINSLYLKTEWDLIAMRNKIKKQFLTSNNSILIFMIYKTISSCRQSSSHVRVWLETHYYARHSQNHILLKCPVRWKYSNKER